MRRRTVALLLALTVSGQGFAAAGDDEELALQPEATWVGWLALLHYTEAPRDGADDEGWRSEIRAPEFFLDAEGSQDPEREWRAARLAFLQPPLPGARGDVEHARCRFPARFAFMKQQLGWRDDELPSIECAELSAFERKLGARSLAVVFASYFLTNPASAFGHTMLYVGSGPSPGPIQLADSGIAFEADTKGQSPLAYIPKGLGGELTAGFRVKPFYDLVRKYERQELRDLWLFPLRVQPEELAQLVRHTWELRSISYQYGFFGGNCAQQILSLVHAVAPRYRLLPFQRAAVLPAEVVRRLVDKVGPQGPPVLRRSLLGRYELAREQLSEAQRQQLDQMIQSRSVPPRTSRAVLAAALLWSELQIPYRTFRRAADLSQPGRHTDSADLRWRRTLLEARELMGGEEMDAVNPGEWQTQTQRSLLDGHAPSRIVLRGGRRRSAAVAELGLRWLLHEPVDPPTGYPFHSSLEVMRIEAGLSAERGLYLGEATLVRLEKLGRSSRLQSPLVWKAELGARQLPTKRGDELHAGLEVDVGLGLATRPQSTFSVAVYGMLGLRPGAAFIDAPDDSEVRVRFDTLGLGTAGLIAKAGSLRARIQAEGTLQLRDWRVGHALRGTTRLGLARDWDAEIMVSLDGAGTIDTTLGVVLFR